MIILIEKLKKRAHERLSFFSINIRKSITLATLYSINNVQKISAFTIGGSSGAIPCRVMEYLNHPDNEYIEFNTSSGKVKMPLFVYFNVDCRTTRSMPYAVEHINGTGGKTNVFVLKRVGDIVVYTPELGEYKMTFYTPVITGLIGKSESENTILCDDIEIKFNVTGSVYDDLNTHETK